MYLRSDATNRVKHGVGMENERKKESEKLKSVFLEILTASRKTDGPCGKQRASFAIKWKVDREQDITSVVVEVNGQVDRASLGGCFICLYPTNLRWVQPDVLAVVQGQFV